MSGTDRCHQLARFGPFEVDLARKELRRRGVQIHLQEKPFQILELLLEEAGEVVSRETLQQRLWPSGTYVDFEKGLNTAIKKLRQALGDSADAPRYVETLPRRGYRLIVPVTFNGAGERQVGETTGTPTNHESEEYSEAGSRTKKREHATTDGRKWLEVRRAGAFAAIALMVVAIVGAWRWSSRQRSEASAEVDLKDMRVAQITNNGRIRFATISPDGHRIAYVMLNGVGQSMRIRDLTTGTDTQVLEPDTVNIPGLAFSPDGRYLYFSRSERLNPVFGYMCRMAVQGGHVDELIRDADSTPSFSPDQKRFVYTRGYPRNLMDVRIADADGSNDHVLKTLEGHEVFDAGATWSPDGTTVAVPIQKAGETRFVLYGISTSDGKTQEVYSSTSSIGRPVWMNDGKSLLVTLEDERTRRGQIWKMSSNGRDARRLTNDLSDYSSAISVSADRRTVLAIVNGGNSDLWWADAKDLSALRQGTTKGSVLGVRSLVDGRFLTFGDGIFVSNWDGSNSIRISDLQSVNSVESCGAYAVAEVNSEGNLSLQRVGLEPMAVPTALVSGDTHFPACTPDGRYLFYTNFDHPEQIHRFAMDRSGSSIVTQVQGDTYFGPIAVSPDGKQLAYSYQQYSPPQIRFVIVSLSDGGMVAKFDGEGYEWGALHWSGDGRALEYVKSSDGTDNLWSQSLSGGKAKQITHYSSGQIFDFSWTRDGKRLLLARGRTTRDIVLMSRERLVD